MNKLPASSGWLWVKQGFQLFRKQPGALSTLFLGYVFCMLALVMLPVGGQILQIILMPVFSMAFMQACLHIEQKKRVLPFLLLSGFRPSSAKALFGLGLLYLLVALLAMGVASLIDDGIFWKIITGQVNIKTPHLQDLIRPEAILAAFAVFLPGTMALCFAAPLIYWQNMGLAKALFFSFFSVLRAAKAFLVFSLAWFAISVIGSQLVILLFGDGDTGSRVLLPLSMIMTVIVNCSLYASYKQLFDAAPKTDDDAAPDLLKK